MWIRGDLIYKWMNVWTDREKKNIIIFTSFFLVEHYIYLFVVEVTFSTSVRSSYLLLVCEKNVTDRIIIIFLLTTFCLLYKDFNAVVGVNSFVL